MSKFKSYRKESRIDWGISATNGEELSRDQVNTGAFLRIADQLEEVYRWGGHANFCGAVKALPKIAKALEKGITVRHEHLLTLKFHWSIHWPWQQKTKRRQRTWRLFKGRVKP